MHKEVLKNILNGKLFTLIKVTTISKYGAKEESEFKSCFYLAGGRMMKVRFWTKWGEVDIVEKPAVVQIPEHKILVS